MRDSDPADHFRTDHLVGDIAGRSIRGGAVTVGAQVLKIVMQFGVTIVLARLLKPEAFGLVAMVAVVLTFLETFKDLGLSAATVQREAITHQEVSTLFWVNAGLGVVAALLMVPLAPLLAWFYGEPELVGITLALGVGFALSGLSTQHLALLRRQMRFSTLASIQMGAEIIGMAVALVAAYEGASYWALILQRIVWAACMALGGWIFCRWRPGRPGRLSQVRSLLGFGGYVTGSNLASLFVRNMDQVLIGWYWGATPLGLYDRAYKILLLPINNLNAPLFSVAMPALSRLAGEPERYRRTYLGMVEKLSMVTMPCAALLVAAPDLVVRLLFGPQWVAATPIVGWLGLAALYQPVSYTCSWLFMTQNRTSEMFRWGLISSGLLAVSIVAGLPFGAEGVAASFALSGIFVRMPALFWAVGRSGPVRSLDIVRTMIPSIVASALAVLAILALRRLPVFDAATLGPALALVGAVAAAVTLICFSSLPQSRRALADFRAMAGSLFPRRINA
ncbi:MAG: lipopolysaccharide biosynthesis protein [Parvibaculum sp.]|uniref:lipopolysaccharide biosynthesis protein n=1 Tax=Parvibaculum sp. TaxID=2024848 RepID=UPI0025DF70E9|nr:lipopolysaccharide biosynthesis protein [Parvibaculum sp.]MCE9650962.1 lipopolysaccharide biosynthesis protein [Parvibaculum sp.]